MFNFYAERFNDVDAHGNVIAALVKWSQGDDQVFDEINVALQCIALGAICAFGVAQADVPHAATAAMIGCGLVVLGVILFFCERRMCTLHCELTFDADGRIWEPRSGIGGWWWGPWVHGDHRWISSIQIEEADVKQPEHGKPAPHSQKRFEVHIYFEDGDTSCVASGLLKRQAHQVAVLMNQARLELRDAKVHSALHGERAWAEVAVE
jgi:hypothetical protein